MYGGEFVRFFGYIPNTGIFLAALLSSIIPLSIYLFNQWLHKHGDAPWKTGQEQKEREE